MNSGLVVAALQATIPELVADKDTFEAYKTDIARQGARVFLYRQYEEGEHRSGITEQMRKMLRLVAEESGIDDFNDNYCQIVIDKMAGRLHITQVTTKDESTDETWLTPLLTVNDFEALQGTIFRAAIRDGDSYVIVDPVTLQWVSEPAFNGDVGLVAFFSGNSKTPYWACKVWFESTVGDMDVRLVVYQPKSVSYWIGKSGTDEVEPDIRFVLETAENMDGGFTQLSRSTTNSLLWPDTMLGKTPVVHFANKMDNYSDVGKSELRPAIPLQDVMNRTLHSMVMASEFSAFRIKWSIGLEIDANGITPGAVINLVLKDKDGNIVTDITPEMADFLNAVKVGQFEETDIGQYITQIDKLAREVSQVTQTPIYGVTTEGVLSGEALKQLEIGLIGKVERFQKQNTDSIREMIQLTALIQNSFITMAETPVGEILEVSVLWQPAELLDTSARIDILVKMRKDAPGLWDDDFYRNKIGALLGMSSAEIEKEGAKAKQTQVDTFESLVGAGGRTLPVTV